ncbi:nitrilase-related carbon-nitrogen hydrolase, partial [Planctomycetota bacterium]
MSTRDPLKIAAIQFEMAEDDKEANLQTMEDFIARAREQDVDVICFPELCLSGYHYHTQMSKEKLLELAEPLDDSPSLKR